MKRLLKIAFFGLLGISLIHTSCSDGAVGDDFADTQYAPKGALVSAINVVTGFFDLANTATSSISFDLSSSGEAVTSTSVKASYNGSPEVELTTASTIPSTIAVKYSDVLSAFGLTAADAAVGDNITFTFDATTSSGTYRSARSLKVPVSCASNLGGTYDYVGSNLVASNSATPCPSGDVTGTVTFTALGGGTYNCSDLGFGQYESSCWSDAPATSANANFTDVCNQITSGGLDQYGLVYTWRITGVSGPDLAISWSNDYADSGDAIITRTDGSNWPPLFTN